MSYELGYDEIAALMGLDDDDDDDMEGDDGDDGDGLYVGDDVADYLVGWNPFSRKKKKAKGKMALARRAAGNQLMQRAMAQQMAAKIAQTKTLIRQKPPEYEGEIPLGFDSGANIAALASATITTNPQVLFKPRRFSVPASIAASFTIDDIKIGNTSMFPNSTPNPAETFSQLGVGIGLKLKTAQIAMAVSIDVTNISGAAARFRATMIGVAAS